jgi:hypothetical protein
MVTVGDADSSPSQPTLALPPGDTSRLSNRAIAGLVVAVMLGMAALGLAFALQTVGIRRANDSKGAVLPEPAVESVVARPAAWPGLGHLPDDVQVLAGVRVADALDSTASGALLGSLGLVDAKKTRILDIAPGNVDHLVIGASLRALPPRVTAVVHGSIGDAPSSGRTTEQHGKTLHRVKLWPTGPEGAIWRADRHTLVAALLPEDFDHIVAKPQAAPILDLMERLDPAALAWLVASPGANDAALAFVTPLLPSADRDAWLKLESVAISIQADGPRLTLKAQIRGRDPAAGEAIAKAVAESLTKAGVTAERKSDSGWQKLTATADAEKLASWLAGSRDAAKR